VQGHVDGVGELLDREPAQQWETVRFRLPAAHARYVVEKGSITIDGVSLTVAAVGADWFAVGLIPTTLKLTTLGTGAPATRSTSRWTCWPSGRSRRLSAITPGGGA
jgi:riboflavin synthase